MRHLGYDTACRRRRDQCLDTRPWDGGCHDCYDTRRILEETPLQRPFCANFFRTSGLERRDSSSKRFEPCLLLGAPRHDFHDTLYRLARLDRLATPALRGARWCCTLRTDPWERNI